MYSLLRFHVVYCVHVTWQRFCAESQFNPTGFPQECPASGMTLSSSSTSTRDTYILWIQKATCFSTSILFLLEVCWQISHESTGSFLSRTILSCCPCGLARNVWWRLPGHRWIRWQGGGHMLNIAELWEMWTRTICILSKNIWIEWQDKKDQ